jgi:hypothetical protein
MKKLIPIVFATTLILLAACNNKQNDHNAAENTALSMPFEANVSPFFLNNFNDEFRDSLLTEIITYIYKAPKGVMQKDRFDPAHWNYFYEERINFTMLDYFIDESGKHYFLLLRPVKSPKKEKRAVGGSFLLDDTKQIKAFVEIFNTPKLIEEEAVVKGMEVFKQIKSNYGALGNYYLNKEFVEFPDERCIYDTSKYEWIYPRELEDKLNL